MKYRGKTQVGRRPSAGPMGDRRTHRRRTRSTQEQAAVEEDDHVALYGLTAIPRMRCPNCGEMSLVVKGTSSCCREVVEMKALGTKRESEPRERRDKPSPTDQAEILHQQDGRCLYCERAFGTAVRGFRGRKTTLRVEWDHFIPFSYSHDNRKQNFVASCHICNALKGARMFQTLDEARAELQSILAARRVERWKEPEEEVAS